MRFLKQIGLLSAATLCLTAFAAQADVRELKWNELKPSDWEAPAVRDPIFYEQNPDLQVQTELDAPVVPELDGQKIKIPGYVVQLEGDDRKITEFLLVPYFGACIHVPPPPPNQIIHVTFPEGVPYPVTYDAVWVTGTLTVEHKDSELALVGYQMEADAVVSYF
ncbi:DUF3299 domain-containing protein [Aliidiomarina shirensis]|uniref:DUF3299 domain-containing protein n=1 Tax=Aliidiomarina shirensis TaxID=1048642 RepID=A0A432WR35_9GAMM|nr:DUF3299 domain-containing protein [Aliidiomarina shirensis]RUO36221.1 DUF3299 domain-containing protein [Aliidiomarina shirensis]